MLYTLTQVDRKTGQRTVTYGHCTASVVRDYLLAYVDSEHDMVVSLYQPPTTTI